MEKFIVNSTAELCQNNHACLDMDGYKPCEVVDCINNQLLFVKCEDRHCAYKLFYGDEVICQCPVRKELYQNYQV